MHLAEANQKILAVARRIIRTSTVASSHIQIAGSRFELNASTIVIRIGICPSHHHHACGIGNIRVARNRVAREVVGVSRSPCRVINIELAIDGIVWIECQSKHSLFVTHSLASIDNRIDIKKWRRDQSWSCSCQIDDANRSALFNHKEAGLVARSACNASWQRQARHNQLRLDCGDTGKCGRANHGGQPNDKSVIQSHLFFSLRVLVSVFRTDT